jgi:hypothetical protein
MRQMNLLATIRPEKPKTAPAPPSATAKMLADFRIPATREEFYDDTVTRAILMLNRWERDEPESAARKIWIKAQDWLCLELDDVSAWVLREL